MTEVSESIRRRIGVAASHRGLTGRALAARLGITPQAVSSVIRGRAAMSSGRLMEFAKALNVSIEYLIGGDDVDGQIDDVLQNRPPRMTGRQLYLAEMVKREAPK